MRCAARARSTSHVTDWRTSAGTAGAASFRTDVRLFRELGPLHELDRHDLAECLGRAADALAALGEQLLAHVGIGDDDVERLVELLDDRLRRLRRNEHRVPGVDLEI